MQAVHDRVDSDVQSEGLREAEAIRLASLNVPLRGSEPLNLFHLRDALKVSCWLKMTSAEVMHVLME